MLKIRFWAAMWAAFFILCLAPPLLAADFLWRAQSPEGGRAYILGSIHVARDDLYPLPEGIMAAFADSRQLVVEMDVEALEEAELLAYVREHALAKDGLTLTERLSPATLEILQQSGFSVERFKPLKAWMAAMTLQVEIMREQGYNEDNGLDRFFLKAAKSRGLKIVELETLPEQMGPLVEMNPEESDLFFRATILELNDLSRIMEGMFAAWRQGDAAAFEDIFFQEYDKYPELVPILEKVIFRRNETMAAGIEELLARPGQPYFVVVGAGHLVGPGSVLEILAESGHTVEQL